LISPREIARSARADGLTVTENLTLVGDDPAVARLAALQEALDSLDKDIRANVVFESGRSGLTRAAKQVLDKVALQLQRYPDLKVEVEGHTDNRGRSSVNEKLSQQRANTVREYLISQSVSAARLQAVGYGDRRPIDSNDTVKGREHNRRVHFNVVERFTAH